MSDHREQLSTSGMQRREQMLHELTSQMRLIHRRRRARRSISMVASAVVFAASVVVATRLLIVHHRATPTERVVRETGPSESPIHAADSPVIVVEFVQTDPTIVDRWRAEPRLQCAFINDDELVDDLAALDKPAGLIRSQGRVWLTGDKL